MTDPDQLERDVTRTRDKLGADVDRLNQKAAPKTVVTTRIDQLKDRAYSVKDRVLGAADNAADSGAAKDKAKDKAGELAGAAKGKADAVSAKVGDAAGNAPDAVREQATGNPIAAGMIAFGVGWLLSSLAPASTAEQDAARTIEANAGPLLDPLTQSAHDVAGNLKQPLQDSAAQLSDTATDAAQRTTQHAKQAADRTAQHAKSATSDVHDHLTN